MQDEEPTQSETEQEAVTASEPQTGMQDVKLDVPPNPIEQATPNQVNPEEVQPVGTETNGEQGGGSRNGIRS